jgi:hypothetical protein
MKTKLLAPAVVFTALIVAPGCASHTTASGGKETTVLGGAVTVATKSFEPVKPATAVDVDTTKLLGDGTPSGNKVTILWGLITLHDY